MRECDTKMGAGPKCYSEQWFCDGYPDCADGSDEPPTCERACLDTEFVCKTGKCLPRAYVCDGQNDCGRLENGERDLSDEAPDICKQSLKCEYNEYSCSKSPQCVALHKFCDGKLDCTDGSDEHTMCHVVDDKSAEKCEYGAAMTLDGVKCYCPTNKFLNETDGKCVFVNHCDRIQNGLTPSCTQGCADNKNGTYTCSCFDPRLTVVNGSCVENKEFATPNIAILTKQKLFVVQNNTMTNFSSMPRPLGKPGALTLVHQHPDFPDAKAPILCLTESPTPNASYITCGSVENTEATPSATKSYAIDFDLAAINMIRFDTIGNNWIFTDASYYAFICAHDPVRITRCYTFSGGEMGTFQDIAYDAVHGQLFVTDSDYMYQGIWRIDVSSGVRFRLTAQPMTSPAITVDPFTQTLYYVDTGANLVRAIDYNSNHSRIAVNGQVANQIKAMDYAEGRLILTLKDNRVFVVDVLRPEWKHWNEMTPPNNGGSNKQVLQVIHFRKNEHVWKSKGKNVCKAANCDDICVGHLEKTTVCLCRDGLMRKDNKCIESRDLKDKPILVMAQLRPSRVRILGFDDNFKTKEIGVPAVLATKRPSAVTFDPKGQRLLMYDLKRHSLVVQRINETYYTVLGTNGVMNCEGMAYDHTADNLYMTDQKRKQITVTRLSNVAIHRVVVSGKMSNPRSIAVHISKSYLFWGSWNEDSEDNERTPAMIERSKLDGSERKTLVAKNAMWINGLTLDLKNDFLYWCDAYRNVIERIRWNGADREILVQGVDKISHPYGLAFFDNHIFYSEFKKGSVKRVNVDFPDDVQEIGQFTATVFDLTVFRNSQTGSTTSPCSTSSNICEHFCFASACKGSVGCEPVKCACSDGMKLEGKGKCVKDDAWVDPLGCDSDMEFSCPISKKCIPKSNLCDGDDDCGDGSDEDPKGACKDFKCVGNKFQCDGTTCLPMEFICDGKSDCYDGADELEKTCAKTPVVKCSASQFRCSNTKCVDKSRRCNGIRDCENGADETECPRDKLCAPDEFRCGSGLCIRQSQVCDGKKQCLDGLDEENCDEEVCLKGRQFRCNAGSACLDAIFRCDGVADCEDASDESEKFCAGQNGTESSSVCAKMNQFMCADGKCLRSFQLCDGFADCLTGEDEKECPPSMCNSTTHLSCANGQKCISRQLECDGVDDCGDNSDEKHCSQIRIDVAELRCQAPMYKCDGSKYQCISDKQLCDGKKDCELGDDEGMWCSFTCATDSKALGCSHTCRATPAGPICSCPDSHYLDKDGVTCVKKDPCRFGQCSQHCVPHGSHHYCYCEDGFRLADDKFSCVSDDPQKPYLIYSNRHEIRMIQSKYPGSSPMISSLINAIALDFKYHQNGTVSVYWTDLSADKIYGGLVDQRTILYKRTIVSYGVFNAEGIAVDWITGNIYWIDSTLHNIQVVSEDGTKRATVVSQDLGNARALAIDVEEGLMFWTDWQEAKPRIERATLAGNSRVVIWQISNVAQAGWPNGITCDTIAKRVYWVDAKSDSIHTITYDGRDHIVVFRDSERLGHAFGIDVYEGHVYFSDWRTNTINKVDKWVGGNVSTIERVVTQPFSLKIVHRSKQKRQLKNACDGFKCNGICLIDGKNKASCQCTNLQSTLDEGCADIDQTVLISTKNSIRGMSTDPPHPHAFPLVSGKQFENIRAVGTFRNRLQVLDASTTHIALINLTGPADDRILSAGSDLYGVSGMTIDPVLGNTYVTIANDGLGRIEVISADGKSKKVVIDTSLLSEMKTPRDIVFVNSTKKLYWFDDTTKPPSIFSMLANGKQALRLRINSTLLENVYNPVVDQVSGRLYWISKGRIVQFDVSRNTMMEIEVPGGDGNVSAIATDVHNGDILIGEFVRIANQTTIRRLKMKNTKAIQRGSIMIVPLHSSERYRLNIVETVPGANQQLPKQCAKCQGLCLSAGKNFFECHCSQGFFMKDGTCTAPSKRIFFATDDGALQSVGWYTDSKTGKIKQLLRAHSLHSDVSKKRIVRVVTDAKKDVVYVVTRQNEVWKCATNGSFAHLVYSTNTHRIAAITIDRVTGYLLVSARESVSTKGVIVLVDADRHDVGMHAVIVEDEEKVPYEIAVDPPKGKMFWASASCIKAANYDGSDVKCIVSKSSITTIAVDEKLSRLCYVDSDRTAIDCVDYDGGNSKRNVAMFKAQGIGELVSIAFNDDELFLFDKFNMSGSIVRGDRRPDHTFEFTDAVVKTSARQKLRVTDFDVMDSENSILFTACSNNNGGCEHLCITTPDGEAVKKKCVCVHSVRNEDGTCSPSRAFIAFTRFTSIEFVSSRPGDLAPPNRQITTDTCVMSKIGAVAADASRGRLYFADYEKFRISAVNFDGTGCVVIAEDVGAIPSMAYDEVHRELYFIRTHPAGLWRIDLADNNLEAYPTEPRIVLMLTVRDRPRHIALHPCRMLIFFTNNAITGSVIERVYYSGFKRESVIQEDLHDLRGLALDLDSEKLYFSDAKDFKISRCDFDGSHREKVVSNTDIPSIHPFELAINDDEIIFTDWVKRAVGAVNKITGNDNRTINRANENPIGVAVVDVDREYCTSDPCSGNDLKCEDYCRLMADGQPVCACNGERRLNSDNRTCTGDMSGKKCAENEFKCMTSDRCIPYDETCDGYNDCPVHDDEDAIYCSTRRCRPGYFSCGNGLCIPEHKKCNRVNDCSNYADETNCTCAANEFRCTSGICVPSSARCDYTQHCHDGSDEMGCEFRNCSKLAEFGMQGLINCATTSQCIHPSWKCDGRNDCYDGWDEKDCLVEFDSAGSSVSPPKKCDERTQFACLATRTCMPKHWQCDGQPDCADGSDEKGCKAKRCTSFEFACPSSDKCIRLEQKCDGQTDCPGGEDETACETECDAQGNSTFRCTNHRCIPIAWRCDGTDDCMDNAKSLGSDEVGCGDGKTSFHIPSRCEDERCIVACELTAILCDGVNDCSDGFDEANCASLDRQCKPNQWMCNSGQCIDAAHLCDARVDCIDGSDEWVEICSLSEPPKRGCPNGWSCVLKNGTIGCLQANQLCDGRRDCMSGIDEQCHLPQGNCSSTRNSCEHSWNCQRHAGFETCSCDEGYHLSPYDQSSCLKSPSCPKANCSHFCVDRRDIGHQCFCAPGYILNENQKDCRRNDTIDPEILLVYGHRLKLFTIDGFAKATLLSNLTNGVALDYDIKSDLIYWTDVTHSGNKAGITSMSNQPNTYRIINSLPTKGIDGIAVDWLGRNIYYTDRNHDAIAVCDMRGRFNKILLKGTPLNDPRAIVLDPLQALLFWTDWGASAHIGRMNMDGSNEQVILQDRTIRWPNALAVDAPAQRLYFGDAHRDYIASCNYDGTKRRMVLRSSVRHIFALAVFEDYIYWSDWQNHTIERVHKITGDQRRTVMHDANYRPMGFKIVHPSLQSMGSLKTARHPCSQPARCDNLCVPSNSPDGFTCMCAQGFRSDGRSCKSECKPNDFICTKTYKCIAPWWRCDGQDDCGDGEDEGYFVKGVCPPFPCDAGQFVCSKSNSTSQCLYASKLCDGFTDCPNGDDEAAEFCENFECTEAQFKCGDKKKCIPLTSVCDKKRDCDDGSDEKECEIKKCEPDFFACVNETSSQITHCIPQQFYCDGEDDCPDGQDEPDTCVGIGECTHEQFQCDSGRCIPRNQRCNAELNCRDASDERGCATECAIMCDDKCVHADKLCDGTKTCSDGSDEDEEACASKKLLEKNELRRCGGFACDGIIDCPDGSDEQGCPDLQCHLALNESLICDGKIDCDSGRDELNCREYLERADSYFQCSKQTVREWQVCDGRWDCADGLDESPDMCASRRARCFGIGSCDDRKQCVDVTTALCDGIKDCADGSDETAAHCRDMCRGKFRCTNGRCIDELARCDGRDDCGDGSDEDTCGLACHHFGVCPQKCWIAYNTTARCHCAPGYARTKNDVFGCEPTSKSVEMFLLNGRMIHLIYVEKEMLRPVFNFRLNLIPGGIDFGYDLFRATLMYSVGGEGYNTEIRSKKWSEGDLMKPWGEESDVSTSALLSYDFMHNNVYFTESASDRGHSLFAEQGNIFVARAQDTRTKTMIVNSTGSITSIAVDPINRLLFWTVSTPVPRILVAKLDGTPIPQQFKTAVGQPHKAIVQRNVFHPISLTLDSPNDRVYWIDAFKRTIETVSYDGRDRRTVRKFELNDGPVAIDLLGGFIYVVTNQGAIHKMHKFNGKLVKYAQTVKDISPAIRLRIAHPAKHTVSHITHQKNPCISDYCPSDTVCVPREDKNGALSPKCLCGPGRFFEVSTKKCLPLREKDQEATQCGDYFCYNNAVCENNYCVCQPGFYGRQCEVSECAERCWNGETCAVRGDGMVNQIECKCASNFTNHACATHVCEGVCGPRGTCRSVPCPEGHQMCRAHTYCECDEGWTGPQCKHKRNAFLCSGHCFNGGQCLGGDKPSQLRCQCPTGFSGARCQNCQDHTCQNGGFCAYGSSNQSSHCVCPVGFTGLNCETYLCKDACPYGSKCSYDITKPLDPIKCSCEHNAAAHNSNCSPICHKQPNWCQNGGSCVDLPGAPGKCKCPPRFAGPRCELPVECDDYCTNDSKCVETNGTHFECECRKGFKGARCDKETRCSECENGSKCVKRPSGAIICQCPAGLGGETCGEITAKSCRGVTCHNGGLCINPNTFQMTPVCLCPPGFGGALCASHSCDNFCHHDGECSLDNEYEPQCKCDDAFFGDRCQYRMPKRSRILEKGSQWWKNIVVIAIAILTLLLIVGIVANRSNRFAVFRQFRHNPLQNHGAPVDQFSNPAYMLDEGGIELVTQNTSLVSSHDHGSFNNPVFEQEMIPIYNDTVENHELLPTNNNQ